MTIPNFKSQHDWEAFTSLFDARWHCKKALLERVKDDLYPKYEWFELTAGALEVINDMVQALLYDVEMEFEDSYPEYKSSRDDVFIPRRSFQENVKQALLEANQEFWNSSNESIQYTEEEMNAMCDAAAKKQKLDLQQQNDLIGLD